MEADAFNPPPQPPMAAPPSSARTPRILPRHIDRLKLDVQRIIPIHYPADNRNVGPGELMKMVGRGN